MKYIKLFESLVFPKAITKVEYRALMNRAQEFSQSEVNKLKVFSNKVGVSVRTPFLTEVIISTKYKYYIINKVKDDYFLVYVDSKFYLADQIEEVIAFFKKELNL